MKFTIKVSDILIGITCTDEFSQKVCRDYIVPDDIGTVDINVVVRPEEVHNGDAYGCPFPYMEMRSVFVRIIDKLPYFGHCLLHGALLAFNGDGYLFTAPSGTGKSTHMSLWKKYLGEQVQYINGDKPFIKNEGSETYAYGTPWCGKEVWNKNCGVKLKGICVLERDETNSVRRLSSKEAIMPLYKQMYYSKETEAALKTYDIFDGLLRNVPVYHLKCDVSEDAVRTSFEAMTNLRYEDYKQGGEC